MLRPGTGLGSFERPWLKSKSKPLKALETRANRGYEAGCGIPKRHGLEDTGTHGKLPWYSGFSGKPAQADPPQHLNPVCEPCTIKQRFASIGP